MNGTIITRENIDEAAAFLREKLPADAPNIAIVLGSGLGGVAAKVENAAVVPYADVPHMLISTAPLHAGRFVLGTISGCPVVCMQGRLHAYEGYSADQIAFPIYVMQALGAETLIVTNAAGGINAEFEVGDLMLIEDHINILGKNPLAGPDRPDVCPRFFDMTDIYTPELRERARAVASGLGISLREGVYIATLGPSFETPAEIRAFRTLGADAVGMSTVFEVTAARSVGMHVLGISMISNPAAGVNPDPIDMDDVGKAAELAAEKLADLVAGVMRA